MINTRANAALAIALTLTLAAAGASAAKVPDGLLFHLSFDKLTTIPDVALGDGKSTFEASLELRSTEGVKGSGLLQRRDERCSYAIAGNLDTSQGSYSIWVKPLSWDGHSGKFRHLLTAEDGATYAMFLYLYPIGDKAVLSYIVTGVRTPQEATTRAGAPVDILKRNEWTHLVSTWDAQTVRVYANGKRVGEGLTAGRLPKLTDGVFTLCPVDYWSNPEWGDADEQTICDEVRIFDHALSDAEVLDLYALDVPGGLQDLKPALTVSLKPDYFASRLEVGLEPAHLDAAWEQRLRDGAAAQLTVTDPAGAQLLAAQVALPSQPILVPVPNWLEGDYLAEATLTAAGETLTGKAQITKPPTPWLPKQTQWRADRVLPPWSPLTLAGQTVTYWNGEVTLPGALPTQITAAGEPLLAAPIRLVADAPATWSEPSVAENQPFRVAFTSAGSVGALSASAQTLMEFDGLIRTDLTLTPPPGGADVTSLALEIPLRPEVAEYYRNPFCKEWDGQSLDQAAFIPYAWLGNERRGLSWFMESDANWRQAQGQPAITLRREGDAVVVRLLLISEPTRLTVPITYTVGFEATPVRPPEPGLYDIRFASGPEFRGSNLFVYGWGQQLSALNARLIAHDPAGQRKLVDDWRAKGQESISYSCTQCTANLSPEYLFFGEEWNQPYGGSYSGYKRVGDEAPYSMVPVCPQSSFAEFLVWCAKQHIENDWSDGIYTDIDGATACDNPRHGCGFTDAFNRTGRTFPLYPHRLVSRRLYTLCRDAGKRYFAHAHSYWYAPFNAFNDGWCPGEQYSEAVMGKPHFYTTHIPDRTWRTELATSSTGVPTFLLPQLERFAAAETADKRGPSECCIVAAMCYGVPLWAGSMRQDVVEEVWGVQQAFGMADVSFVPYWEQQEFTAADPQVRISLWRKPGARLLVLSNFTDQDRTVELSAPAAAVALTPAWNAGNTQPAQGALTVTVPAYNGVLLTATGVAD